MKTKTSIWILAILLIIPITFIMTSFINSDRLSEDAIEADTVAENVDDIVSSTMVLGRTIRQIGLELRYSTGEVKQDGVFISPQGLMKDIDPPDDRRMNATHSALSTISEYAKDMEIPVYLSVFPNASAILQQNLPLFYSAVNQKNVIENIYNQLSGQIITINAYNTLLENRGKYIYYRTEDNFTLQGGYYIYRDLIRRIWVSEEALDQREFSIEYAPDDFFGELYQKVPYDRISPDVLMRYNRRDSSIEHKIEKTIDNQTFIYHSLYPEAVGENPLNIYMGGNKGVTDITSTNTYSSSLLVFADNTFLSYVPFLANHYERITVVNLFEEESNLDNIRIKNYDQILFALNVENYVNNLDLSVLLEIMENQWNE